CIPEGTETENAERTETELTETELTEGTETEADGGNGLQLRETEKRRSIRRAGLQRPPRVASRRPSNGVTTLRTSPPEQYCSSRNRRLPGTENAPASLRSSVPLRRNPFPLNSRSPFSPCSPSPCSPSSPSPFSPRAAFDAAAGSSLHRVLRERAAGLLDRVRPLRRVHVAVRVDRDAFPRRPLIRAIFALERRDEPDDAIFGDRTDPDAVVPVRMVQRTRLRVDDVDRLAPDEEAAG